MCGANATSKLLSSSGSLVTSAFSNAECGAAERSIPIDRSQTTALICRARVLAQNDGEPSSVAAKESRPQRGYPDDLPTRVRPLYPATAALDVSPIGTWGMAPLGPPHATVGTVGARRYLEPGVRLSSYP